MCTNELLQMPSWQMTVDKLLSTENDSVYIIHNCIFTVEDQEALQRELKAVAAAKNKTGKRKSPTCKKCGQPKKGHPRSSCPLT